LIEDISTTKDVVKKIQVNTCDICNNEINTIKYLNVSSSSSNKNKKSAASNNNEEDDYNKYYNICLNCVEKIAKLMKYNYGFDGRLIQFFESLTEKKLKKGFNKK
jgi:hypothetical protein